MNLLYFCSTKSVIVLFCCMLSLFYSCTVESIVPSRLLYSWVFCTPMLLNLLYCWVYCTVESDVLLYGRVCCAIESFVPLILLLLCVAESVALFSCCNVVASRSLRLFTGPNTNDWNRFQSPFKCICLQLPCKGERKHVKHGRVCKYTVVSRPRLNTAD